MNRHSGRVEKLQQSDGCSRIWEKNNFDNSLKFNVSDYFFFAEPILGEGDDNICIYDDGWTALSLDDSRSAQFEHTILITDHGVDVLTS